MWRLNSSVYTVGFGAIISLLSDCYDSWFVCYSKESSAREDVKAKEKEQKANS